MDTKQAVRIGPAYRVVTARLVIRCWEPFHARLLRAAVDESDGHLRPWIPWMKDEPKSLQETVEWLRKNRGNFDLDHDFRYGVFDPEESTLIGETGLYTRVGKGAREIGYWIRKQATGRGYASEAAAAMVKTAFEIDRVDRVEIHCAVTNRVSAIIPEKLGFTHEANLKRRSIDTEGEIHDLMIWTLFAKDYPGSSSSKLQLTAYDAQDNRIL